MRKLSLAMMCLAIAGLMTMVSCRKPNIFNGKKLTFKATIDNNGAKTTLDGLDVKWSTDDAISINGGKFTLKGTGGTTSGEFEGIEVDKVDGNYFASYPYSNEEGYTNDGKSVKFNIDKDNQFYYANNYQGDVSFPITIPMVACVTDKDTQLQFKNMVNILKLNLTGCHTIKKIEIESDNEKEYLNGVFTVESTTPTAPNEAENGTKSITLNLNPSIVLDANIEKTVYVMLPVFSSADNTISFKFTTSQDIVKTAGPIALKDQSPVPNENFGSDHPGNLYNLSMSINKESVSITSQLQSFNLNEYPVNP